MSVKRLSAMEEAWADHHRRVALAERLALELASASHKHGSDFVASRLVQVRYQGTPDFRIALDHAPTSAYMGGPPAVGVYEGDGGVVMYVHMPDLYSVVCPLVPYTGLVLVCADDLRDHCMQLHDDSPEAREALANFYERLRLSLINRAEAQAEALAEGKRGIIPAEPRLPLID
jgi:hypothetical protein